MPLWAANLIFALFIIATLASGVWLLLNIDAMARLFAGKGDMVAAPQRPPVSRGRTWLMLAIFNIGWIGCVLIWLFVMGGEGNEVVRAAA